MGANQRDAIVIENLSICDEQVEIFVTKREIYAHLREDLRSAAVVGLVRAADRIVDGKVKPIDLERYLSSCVRYAIADEVYRLVADASPRTCRRIIAEGRKLAKHLPLSRCDASQIEQDDETDVQDIELESVAGDEIDRQLIQLRSLGWSEAEIGSYLGVSQQAIHHRRQSLRSRFIRRSDSND